MNAKEFAHELEKAASFIRQQQAEIEALNDQIREKDVCLKLLANEIDSLKSVVYWLKENRPEVWNDIKKWSKL